MFVLVGVVGDGGGSETIPLLRTAFSNISLVAVGDGVFKDGEETGGGVGGVGNGVVKVEVVGIICALVLGTAMPFVGFGDRCVIKFDGSNKRSGGTLGTPTIPGCC